MPHYASLSGPSTHSVNMLPASRALGACCEGRRTWSACRQPCGAHGHATFRRRVRSCNVVPLQFDMCTLVAVGSSIDSTLYDLGQKVDQLVQLQLTGLSPASYGIVLLAGLLTSFSPCTLSVLPLTIGYMGGYSSPQQSANASSSSSSGNDCCSTSTVGASSNNSSETASSNAACVSVAASSPAAAAAWQPSSAASATNSSSNSPDNSSSSSPATTTSSKQSSSVATQAVCFSLGLASSLAGLGLASSLLGKAYGQLGGKGLPIAVGLVAVVMGLNLLEVMPLRLPSLDVDVRKAKLPAPLTAYLAGAAFALAASPCSTPVLASLMAYVSTNDDPIAGAGLLLAYSCGYVAPLLVAATVTGAAKQLLDIRKYSNWITPTSGVLLVAGGTYTLLSRALPMA